MGEINMKRATDIYDFKAFGAAIKAARKAKGISRNQLADKMGISPRYIASLKTAGNIQVCKFSMSW